MILENLLGWLRGVISAGGWVGRLIRFRVDLDGWVDGREDLFQRVCSWLEVLIWIEGRTDLSGSVVGWKD